MRNTSICWIHSHMRAVVSVEHNERLRIVCSALWQKLNLFIQLQPPSGELNNIDRKIRDPSESVPNKHTHIHSTLNNGFEINFGFNRMRCYVGVGVAVVIFRSIKSNVHHVDCAHECPICVCMANRTANRWRVRSTRIVQCTFQLSHNQTKTENK